MVGVPREQTDHVAAGGGVRGSGEVVGTCVAGRECTALDRGCPEQSLVMRCQKEQCAAEKTAWKGRETAAQRRARQHAAASGAGQKAETPSTEKGSRKGGSVKERSHGGGMGWTIAGTALIRYMKGRARESRFWRRERRVRAHKFAKIRGQFATDTQVRGSSSQGFAAGSRSGSRRFSTVNLRMGAVTSPPSRHNPLKAPKRK